MKKDISVRPRGTEHEDQDGDTAIAVHPDDIKDIVGKIAGTDREIQSLQIIM